MKLKKKRRIFCKIEEIYQMTKKKIFKKLKLKISIKNRKKMMIKIKKIRLKMKGKSIYMIKIIKNHYKKLLNTWKSKIL